jgi:hypothetical protein
MARVEFRNEPDRFDRYSYGLLRGEADSRPIRSVATTIVRRRRA